MIVAVAMDAAANVTLHRQWANRSLDGKVDGRGDVAGLRWDQRGTHRVLIDGVERQFDGFDIVQSKNKERTGGSGFSFR